MPDTTWKKSRFALYLIAFLFNLHSAIPTYVTSTFLSQFTGNAMVGVVYTAASILALIAFACVLRVLRRFGNIVVTLALCLIEFISLIILAFAPGTLAVIVFFMTSFASVALINFTLDALLEDFSTQNKTGDIRGIYYTADNLGWLLAPLIAALLLGAGDNFSRVFFAIAGILTLSIVLIAASFQGFKDPEYSKARFWTAIAEFLKDRDMRGIYICEVLIQFFYAWMIIYTPIYLHQTVGFSWTTIGILFSIMLLPFVLVGIPEGFYSDRGLGERKFIALGFLITAVATLLCALYGDGNVFVWGILLFVTRIGAASAEVMSDTYFFKKINGRDIEKITLFRTARPLAYVISSVAATLILIGTNIQGLLVVLGILMFYGIRVILSINDVK